jgi:hypothetical protein
MSIFDQLLEDLSKEMNVSLKEDDHHTCLINFEDKIKVQVELDTTQENLIIGAVIGELAPGKYRESVLKEALKENGQLPPKIGIFAYSPKKNALVFFNKFSIQDLDTKNLLVLINEFKNKALTWKETIDQGNVPFSSSGSEAQNNKGSIFDIKR